MALFQILVDIGARTAGIEAALTRVEGRVTDFSHAIGRLGDVVALGSIAAFAEHIINLGSTIEHASIKAGVTTTAFQELAFAAKQTGVGTEELDAALIRMNRSLSLASTGAKTQNDTLRALGLTFNDLKDLAPDKQFEVLADRISKLASPADRARAEIVLFGRAGGELGALMDKGAAGIQEMRKQAEELGAVIDEKTVKALEESHKAIERLESSFSSLAATLVGKVAPALTFALDNLLKMEAGEKQQMLAMQKDFAWLQVQPHLPKRIDVTAARPPGFEASQIPDLSVHPNILRTGTKGVEALLAQFNRDTVRIEDQAEAEYQQTKIKLEELLRATVIDAAGNITKAPDAISAEEFARRMHQAAVKYNAAFDQLQPIIITAKRVIDLASIEAALNRFTDDVKGALHKSINESGNFGKNLLRNILQALEDRAITQAIDELGVYIFTTLQKAFSGANTGGGGGWAASLLGAVIGAFGGSTAVAGSAAATAGAAGAGPAGERASGGFVASRKTYLIGERGPELFTPSGSGNITPNEQLGGGGMTFAPTYNINAPNGDQQLRNALPGLLAATAARSKRDMLEAFHRNNLPAPRVA